MKVLDAGICYRAKKRKDGGLSHVIYWKVQDANGKWRQVQRGILYPPSDEVRKLMKMSRATGERRRNLILNTPWLKAGGVR